MLRKLTKLYWGSGFGGWGRWVKDCEDRFLFLNSKYKFGNDGRCVPSQLFKTSGFWNSLIYVKDDVPWIRFRVHDGCRVRFWRDKWCIQSVLLNLFPNLYLLERRQQAFFAENLLIISGRVM